MKKIYPNKVPESGERFSYVVTKPDRDFDIRGYRLHFKISEKMEFVDIAQEMKRKIDLAYYLEKVFGLCVRFIM